LAEIVGPLLQGAAVSLVLTLAVPFPAGLVAFSVAFARLSRWRSVRAVAVVFVEVFRGTSFLVQVFAFYYVLPFFGLRLGAVETAILALSLNFGAYGSEVVRSTILNVDRGQWDVAKALNMPPVTTMRRIILPQALVAMLPPFGNFLVELLHATAFLSLITIRELTYTANETLAAGGGSAEEVYSVVLLLYLLMGVSLTQTLRLVERRLAKSLPAGQP
jgi:polar amino acid transport system permease protein